MLEVREVTRGVVQHEETQEEARGTGEAGEEAMNEKSKKKTKETQPARYSVFGWWLRGEPETEPETEPEPEPEPPKEEEGATLKRRGSASGWAAGNKHSKTLPT